MKQKHGLKHMGSGKLAVPLESVMVGDTLGGWAGPCGW